MSNGCLFFEKKFSQDIKHYFTTCKDKYFVQDIQEVGHFFAIRSAKKMGLKFQSHLKIKRKI